MLLDIDVRAPRRGWKMRRLLEPERDLAAALGWSWRRWCVLRATLIVVALTLGVMSGVATLTLVLIGAAALGFRYAVSGRAARRRLRMERAFLLQMSVLRDRIAIGNQSLDTALQDMAATAHDGLGTVIAPLSQGGLTSLAIVSVAQRSRSAIVEHACAVLLWSRTRSLDALLAVFDDVLLPVGEAQLAVEEESLITLTQQRAVSFAMAALMLFMFLSVVRVASLRHFYETLQGTVVLLVALAVFTGLLALLGRLTRVSRWTRWDMARMAEQEAAHG
ncbi:MAG: hypothetical protein JOZ46_12170 [Candidatus Dormibacteraeota bacterium]|nr:hypothetical protein [Candidatus Dormibacteraeota bacterium]